MIETPPRYYYPLSATYYPLPTTCCLLLTWSAWRSCAVHAPSAAVMRREQNQPSACRRILASRPVCIACAVAPLWPPEQG